MKDLVVGYRDKSLKKILFHAGTGFYVSDSQSANIFKDKKAARVVLVKEARDFKSHGRKDVKLHILSVTVKEIE